MENFHLPQVLSQLSGRSMICHRLVLQLGGRRLAQIRLTMLAANGFNLDFLCAERAYLRQGSECGLGSLYRRPGGPSSLGIGLNNPSLAEIFLLQDPLNGKCIADGRDGDGNEKKKPS